MTRSWLFILSIVVLSNSATALAQHHHQGQRVNNSQGFQQSIAMNSPFVNSGMGFGRPFGHHRGMPYLFGVYVVQPPQVTTYPYPYPYPVAFAPAFIPPSYNADKSSTPASRLKSLDFQVKGDQRMREQKWSEARAAYANAITAAPDQADAHFKLAVCYVTIQRFDNAIREFKRAIKLDPKSIRTAKSLKTLFGPDGQIIRNSIVSKLGIWAKEDLHNPDRLFLYGAMLHLNGDPQSREVLESAMKENGGDDSNHIARFLNPDADPMKGPFAEHGGGIPALNGQPIAVASARPVFDLRFPNSSTLHLGQDAPVPMPDGPVPMQDRPMRDRPMPLPDAPVPMP